MLNIVSYRKTNYIIFGAIFLVSIVFLGVFGLRKGVDFTGGSLLVVTTRGSTMSSQDVQEILKPLDLGEVNVQKIGEEDFNIRLRTLTESEHQSVLKALQGSDTAYPKDIVELSFSSVGPSVGSALQRQALGAIVVACILIVLFITWAFRKVSAPIPSWKYGVVAVLTLVHDAFIVLGVFAVLGHYFDIEIDLPFIAALLTVIGYSVNDKIVVFDRIRENLLSTRANFEEIINMSLNQTLARSINTSLTVAVVLIAIVFFGGSSIFVFALTLLLGICFGAYSSIFIASPLLVTWYNYTVKKGKS